MIDSSARRAEKNARPHRTESHFFPSEAGSAPPLHSYPHSKLSRAAAGWNPGGAAWRAGDFFRCLPPGGIDRFESLAAPYQCKESKILLTEGEPAGTVLFLLEGSVKVSMNSIDGRRLVLGIAGPGDILGLAAALSGLPHELTAEAQFTCRLATLSRRTFLEFLARYPEAGQSVVVQLSHEYRRVCDLLRNFGIKVTSSTRLARLLLQWCEAGSQTEIGTRIHCSLTHEEIGECIGVARETVSRTLSELKQRKLITQHGATLVVSSVRDLEIYAGQGDV